MDLWDIPSRVANAGLVGLVVLDVALVGVALRPTEASKFDQSPVRSGSTGSAGAPKSPVSKTPATKTHAPGTATTALAAPLQTMLVAIDNQRAWRVGAGACDAGGATLATTSDGGKTWAAGSALPRRIVRVQPSDGRAAFVVGADASCAALLMSTTDGGGTWGAVGNVAGVWFRDPKDARVLGAPGSSSSQPCGTRAVLDLAVVSTSSARVLCLDGVLRQTTDTGSTWTDAGNVTGAVALAVASAETAQTYVARLDAPGCSGVAIVRVGQDSATSCVRSPLPKDPGQIAMSLVKGGGWLVVGDTTMRSTDNLVTWSVS